VRVEDRVIPLLKILLIMKQNVIIDTAYIMRNSHISKKLELASTVKLAGTCITNTFSQHYYFTSIRF